MRAAILFGLGVIIFEACAQDTPVDDYVLTDRLTISGDPSVRFDILKSPSDPFHDRLQVFQGAELIYSNESAAAAEPNRKGPYGAFELCSVDQMTHGRTHDIDGDGLDEVVALHYTGGIHCCRGYLIFSTADKAKLLTQIEPAQHYLLLTDFDADGTAECQLQDVTFHYWHAGNASPFPRIIFRYSQGKLLLATDLMKTYPDVDEDADVAELRAAFELSRKNNPATATAVWEPLEYKAWEVLLRYIYSGQAAKGWQLFQDAWPDDKPGYEEFQLDFNAQLKKSPHYDSLMAMQESSVP